jgi:choline kinase
VQERVPDLERTHGVRLELVYNDRALEWNNAYSMWCAREAFGRGVLLVNGDTITPADVMERLLAARGATDVVIALDDEKRLADEEMKVRLNPDRRLLQITKQMDPAGADGEYIGLTLMEPAAAGAMADALEATWRRDPQLYYEDGFQEYADRGGQIGVASIGGAEWVEVDDHSDLERAREVACRC